MDLAALAWLRPLLDRQLAEAEARLVNAGRQDSSPAEVLRCLWAVHHVSAGLRSLGLELALLLGLELERSLRQLLLEDIATERRNLILGGIMRGLQTLPAAWTAWRRVAKRVVGAWRPASMTCAAGAANPPGPRHCSSAGRWRRAVASATVH